MAASQRGAIVNAPSPRTLFFVEDDPVFAAVMVRFFEKNGFAVEHFTDGAGVVDRACAQLPDAVILDGSLPGVDGFDLCRALRPCYPGPILMLTARDEDIDELLGLELGADDYIRKPAEPRIVLARLKARMRRPEAPAPAGELRFGALEIHRCSRSVQLGSSPVELTTAEFDLLWLLASRSGETLSRDDIFRATRGLEYDGLDRSVDMRVSRLRKLLGDDTDPARLIRTVRGKGYLFSRIDWS
jgi:two-component system OmpR family response regulator/two-component system response regulator RstA